jgi:hypothetical protein
MMCSAFHHCIVYNPKGINTKGWCDQSSYKKFNLVIKLSKLYPFDPLIIFLFNFSKKNYFYYFPGLGLRKERKIVGF